MRPGERIGTLAVGRVDEECVKIRLEWSQVQGNPRDKNEAVP